MTWLVDHFVAWLEQAGIWILNQLIISLGALVSSLVGSLPDMPSFPAIPMPDSVRTWFDFGGYWFPFGYLLDTITVVVALAVVWFFMAIPLRWAKAVRGSQ